MTTSPRPAPERSIFGLVRAPGRRATTGVLVVALLVAAICWYLGADVWHSILFGGVLTTVGLIVLGGATGPDPRLTDWRGARPNQIGARSDVAGLSGSLRGSYGRVGSGAVSRVQRLAQHRLAPYQLDLGDPADRQRIEQLIGRRAYAVLVRGRRRPPLLRSLLRCLDVLDALDPTRPAAPSRSQRRRRRPAFHRPRRADER